MDAETLNCPMCGAPASTDATRCEHCGAQLATVACPSCFGLMFAGAKYCSHCGARAKRTEVPGAAALHCPRCRAELRAVVVGNANLEECPGCEGIWVDNDSLEQICRDREEQSAVLGTVSPLDPGQTTEVEKIRYVPCPICAKLMNRVNFARCSHVVVDVCKAHGSWFDRDELRHIVEFIRAGGMEKARELELEELEEQRRRLKAQKMTSAWSPECAPAPNYPECALGISAAAALIRAFLK